MAKEYNPKLLTMTVADAEMAGFAESTMLKIARNSDATMKAVGVDGEYSVSVSADEGGTYEFSLMQTSSSNDILDALRLTPGFRVYIHDNNGRLVQESPSAWIQSLPEQEFAASAKERKWVIGAEKIKGQIAGSNDLG